MPTIQYKQSHISYIRFGTGSELMFALHGYGQSAEVFSYFENEFHAKYTVIAIDLVEHGQSIWKQQEGCNAFNLLEIFNSIAEKENCQSEKFHLMAFSIGTRYAMAFAQVYPNCIKQLILIAPPSFSFNRLMLFTINTVFGNWLFRYFIQHHNQLLSISKMLNKIGMMSRAKLFFVSKFMGEKAVLEKVYKRWHSYRRLTPHFKQFVTAINANHLPVTLIAGKSDVITPPTDMVKLIERVKNNKVYLIHEGHKLQTPAMKALLCEM